MNLTIFRQFFTVRHYMTDLNDKLNDIVEKAKKEGQDIVDRYKKESNERLEKMNKYTDDLDAKSMHNFAEWRDYLHKYYVLMLTFIGGSGIFSAIQQSQEWKIIWGIYLALGGVIFGFCTINIYFYLERKWFQISNYVSIAGFGETQQHPDVENDVALATRLNLSQKIKQFQVQLKEAKRNKDKKRIHYLKQLIKGHKMERGLMKYLGQQFGFIERFWVSSVIISLLLTSVGTVLVFVSLLHG